MFPSRLYSPSRTDSELCLWQSLPTTLPGSSGDVWYITTPALGPPHRVNVPHTAGKWRYLLYTWYGWIAWFSVLTRLKSTQNQLPLYEPLSKNPLNDDTSLFLPQEQILPLNLTPENKDPLTNNGRIRHIGGMIRGFHWRQLNTLIC